MVTYKRKKKKSDKEITLKIKENDNKHQCIPKPIKNCKSKRNISYP